jgi:excisionase family DNA binding protein
MAEQIVVLTKSEIEQVIREAVKESLPAPEPAKAWDVEDVARFLDVSAGTVYTMAANNEIPHRRIGRLMRFSPREVAEWLAGLRRGK